MGSKYCNVGLCFLGSPSASTVTVGSLINGFRSGGTIVRISRLYQQQDYSHIGAIVRNNYGAKISYFFTFPVVTYGKQPHSIFSYNQIDHYGKLPHIKRNVELQQLHHSHTPRDY